jgi:predicted Zn-dependent protease
VKPDSGDAYLALGAANYIIGSLPVHKRFLLRLGGVQGDRNLGMKQLEIAARQGDYLRPFAKILLALAALREKQADLARTELEELVHELPENPLFARELAMRRNSSSPASSPHS